MAKATYEFKVKESGIGGYWTVYVYREGKKVFMPTSRRDAKRELQEMIEAIQKNDYRIAR